MKGESVFFLFQLHKPRRGGGRSNHGYPQLSMPLCLACEYLYLGAVPCMGRQSRCTCPFWVFASFCVCVCVCVCLLYYKFILYITRGAPNKAVKKKFPAALPFYVTDPQGRINYKFKLLTGVNEPQESTSSFLTCPQSTLLSSPLQSRLGQQSIAHCLAQSTFTFTMLKWLPKSPVTFHNIT